MTLDKEVYAVCACGKDIEKTTLRRIKNSWPHCTCRQSMKVTDDLPVSARDRVRSSDEVRSSNIKKRRGTYRD